MGKSWLWVESKGDKVTLWANGVLYLETSDAIELAGRIQQFIAEGYELVFR